MSIFVHPARKWAALSSRNKKQLWVVAYVNQEKSKPASQAELDQWAIQDVEASLEGGADAVVLINEWCSLPELESAIRAVRAQHPRVRLGVNYLGDDAEPYGWKDSFRLAREHSLEIVWTDFSGVDRIVERPLMDLHAARDAKPPSVFYASGIHMKYSTLVDPGKSIEESALQAMGWVDGVIVTGPKTGVPCDPETARRARAAIGPEYPLGVASGVTPENVHQILPWVDFYLVASSLQDSVSKRIDRAKVAKLRQSMDAATPGMK